MNDDSAAIKRRNKPLPIDPHSFNASSLAIELEVVTKEKPGYLSERSHFSHSPPTVQIDSDPSSRRNVFSIQDSKRLPSAPLLQANYSSKQQPRSFISALRKQIRENRIDLIIALFLTVFSMFTRLYKISIRNSVTWDEAHFGKFGAHYINHTFYHDVHPPLAKMLVALAEVIAGHNGTYTFNSGETYPSYVNYSLMRIQIAMYGVLLAPIAFFTSRSLLMSRKMSTLAGLFIIFDNALCVISKFILLDQPLLFFTSLSIMCFTRFNYYRRRPFTEEWWIWLTLTGLSLGCVLSSKWIGLFCVATVGLATVEHLWEMYGKPAMPADIYLHHWAGRILCLICVPLMVYLFSFYIHFALLYKDGSGTHVLSSNFQARMIGHPLNVQPINVANNSTARLRSYYSRAGLLHSHNHTYPMHDRQHQANAYQSKDPNNLWTILLDSKGESNKRDEVGTLQSGDILKLIHSNSSRVLRVVSAEAPLTHSDLMVSAYGKADGENLEKSDLWKLEIYKQQGKFRDDLLHPMLTKFALRNVKYSCLLRTQAQRLPSWGWKQSQVSCIKTTGQTKKLGDDVLWNIEEHKNTKLKDDNMRNYISTVFLFDFVQLNVAMSKTNNALVADKDKYNAIESSPSSWPFLQSPMRMVGWGDNDIKYYEIGNPVLWWLSSVICLLFPLQYVFSFVAEERQKSANRFSPPNHTYTYNNSSPGFSQIISTASSKDEPNGVLNSRQYWFGAKLLWTGWFFHYFPFFLMGRVTYLHHYLPALYFALLLTALQVDYFSRSITKNKKTLTVVFVCCVVVSGLVFWYFFPFTVGYKKPARDLAWRKWRSSWNVYKDPLEM